MDVNLIIKLVNNLKNPCKKPSRAKYTATEILLIPFVTVMCGAKDWYEMEEYAEVHFDYFHRYFPIWRNPRAMTLSAGPFRC